MSVTSTHALYVAGDTSVNGGHAAVRGEVLDGSLVSLSQGSDRINMTPQQAKELVIDLKKLLTLEQLA